MRIGAYKELAEGLYLTIHGSREGVVMITAVDKRGEHLPGGSLATITDRGISLESGVNPDIGLPLDSNGRLILL